MFEKVLLLIHIIIVALLILSILFQKSEGGALGIGGSNNFMSARGSANLLTRVTAVLASVFFISTLLLAVNFKGAQKSQSIFNESKTSKNTK